MKFGDSVETEGNTIDEAIESALERLGAEREQVEIEIVSDAAKGILGIGKKKARIRASVRPPLATALAPGVEGPEPGGEALAHDEPGGERTGAVETSERAGIGLEAETASADAAERAKHALEEILERMGFAVTIAADGQGEDATVRLLISGDHSGLLIGRHGQTLDALEYLVSRLAFRGEDAKQRLQLECGDYRQRRKAALEQMAFRMAERVKRKGRAVTMEAMSPRDRRIVHLALHGDSGLTTRSVGVGYYRKLRIMPAGDYRRTRS